MIREDNVDTDVLYPGPFLSIQDVDQMKAHLFEGLDPTLRDELVGDTILDPPEMPRRLRHRVELDAGRQL